MLNSMIICNFFHIFCFGAKIHFFSKFFPKTKLFKMKLCTETNSNMLNVMVLFLCNELHVKYTFKANLVQAIEIVCLRIQLVARLIQIWYIQFQLSFILLCTEKTIFEQIWLYIFAKDQS